MGNVTIFLEKNCLFIRASILDNFSLLYKDVLFGFYHADANLMDKYFLINLFILLAIFLYTSANVCASCILERSEVLLGYIIYLQQC